MYERNGLRPVPKVDAIASSRVDMLIAVYKAAIDSIDEVIANLSAGQPHQTALARSQAIVLVGLIESGLDLSQGEIPNRIMELCGFVENSILQGKEAEIKVARKVLCNLRDGFIEIRDEATKLEDAGEIPALSSASSIDTVI